MLDQPFAETGFADNQAAAVILNRAGHNFRRRGSAAVNQDNERHVFRIRTSRLVNNRVAVFRAALDRHHHLAPRQKFTGYVDCLIE